MSREYERSSGPRAIDEASAPASPSKRSLIASRYPALARALGSRGGDAGAPTIHDAATAAVDHKSGGAAVDSSVAGRVGGHLGADFSGVRVHSDPLAQQATAAMGARAFAYGSDVFLGPGESGGDLGLMAHELTHVAQQGAAGQRAPQRAVQVGDADSPAEREADQVAADVTGGQGRAAALLVDDGPVGPGQMLKSQFLEQLRAEVTAAADAELGPIYAAIGCPYIDQYFGRYVTQPAAAGEALLRRFAPATRTARAAADLIPAVVARVRDGVRAWRETGEAPPDLAGMVPADSAAAAGPAQAQALRAPDGSETLASLEAELGPGQPLDGATASRMSDALGIDVSSARLHTGTVAARKAADAGAVAFAVGSNVVMGAGAPGAGTLEGDALLAHELAHTVQQAGAASDPAARRRPIGGEDQAAEDHADAAAAGAVEQLHGGARTGLVQRLGGALKTGLQLQRCSSKKKQVTPATDTFTAIAPAVRAAPDPTAREAALAPGIAGAEQRRAALRSMGSSSGPVPALRARIIAETNIGAPGAAKALDDNPYSTLQASHVEAAWRAWAENPGAATEPWTLLAIWMKEGLSARRARDTFPANDAADARAIYRSRVYFQNMGADHFIHFTAGATGDNDTDFRPGTGAAHDAKFHSAIAQQVAAGRLPRDVGPEIDAELTVTEAGGNFTVTKSPRFDTLSLMLVDAYWRENRAAVPADLGAHGASAAGDDLEAITYMRWNMGAGRFNQMLGRDMSGNRDADGSTPQRPTWALHREVKVGEWDEPRANAIRFQFYLQAYRHIFEGGY